MIVRWISGGRGSFRFGSARIDADPALLLGSFEFDDPIDQREECVIAAQPDVPARLERGAALSDQDGACPNRFTGELLHAEHLGLAVAPVARAADALLVCH